jgi:predicted GH43/DUF377 family glycosyl hydrolase
MQPSLILACSIALSLSAAQYQYIWKKSPANPVLAERSDLVDDPGYVKYAFEPTVLVDSSSQIYRMWFTSLAQGFGAGMVISDAVSTDGTEWFAGMKNPVFRGENGSFDVLVRGPRVIHDATGYKMYYTGQSGNDLAIGLAISPDGKTWQRYSSSPILKPDTVGKWNQMFQAFCDVYYDGTTYFMWSTGGDGAHNDIGLAKSPDGIHWSYVPGNPVFTRSASGWDSASVGVAGIVRVGRTLYMFYTGSAIAGTVNFSIGLATSEDGIHWVRYGTAPVLEPGPGWEGVSLASASVLYRNGTFHIWYSALSTLTGHWQTGYATSPLAPFLGAKLQQTTDAFALMQNYPNPFNPETVIRYTLPRRSHVSLGVYDILGQQVADLVHGEVEAGTNEIRFDGTGLASGVYFYRIEAGSFTETKRLLLVK